MLDKQLNPIALVRRSLTHAFWAITWALAASFVVTHWLGGSLFGCPAWACGLIVALANGVADISGQLYVSSLLAASQSDRSAALLEEVAQRLRPTMGEEFRTLAEKYRKTG